MAKANKLIVIAIILFCCLCVVFVQNADFSAYAYDLANPSQENSEQNPYLITSAQDMVDLSSQVLSGNSFEGIYFRLAQNITLDSSFIPIGNLSNQFKGIFDGNNFTVSLNINNSTAYNGLFGAIGLGGAVKNLRVVGSVSGGNNLGGIAGYSLGTIDNCINQATIMAKTAQTVFVGGIVGQNYGLVTDCINRGSIIANRQVGGIVGNNAATGNSISTINGVINLGDIKNIPGNTSDTVGGLVGQNDGTVKNGYNHSLITNTGEQIGSLIGFFSPTGRLSESKNCYNNTDKSSYKEIGYFSAQIKPENYVNYSMYDFLGKTPLIFESGIMSVKEFDIGYGYFPMLSPFINESSITNWVRHSLFAEGTGFAHDPFVIRNIEQWNLFATNTKLHDYKDCYVKLDANIEQITPLSSVDKPFNGNFDGNNKTITLAMAGNSFLGVFSYIGSSGKVSNLNINGWIQASGMYAGSVAGSSGGSIENIINTAKVTASSFAGGIAGRVYNEDNVINFTNVKNQGQVEGIANIGGIAGYGYNAKTDSKVVNTGRIQGHNVSAGMYFGGIFGQIENSLHIDYETWLNNGEIYATKASYVAGLVGKIELGSIKGSINIAKVTGNKQVGGITAHLSQGILDSVAVIASITGSGNTAGIIGALGTNASIIDSYFSGKFYPLPKSTIDPTFAIIANSNTYNLTLTNVYYNEDILDDQNSEISFIIPSPQGVGANCVQLTNVNGSAHNIEFSYSNEYFDILPMSLGFGYYPIPKNFDQQSQDLIKAVAKYNYFNAGDGAENTPFEIGNAQNLYNLSYLHNNYTGYDNLEYIQTANITLDAEFTPIGTSKEFSGKYNGNYFKINNLIINGQENGYYGLFGIISNANVEKVAIASGIISGVGYIGSIAGEARNSTILNSYSLIDIVSLGASYAGGVVGYANGGKIEYCFNAGRINAKASAAGGIAGYSAATISQSFNMGMVIADSGAAAGGIVGINSGGHVQVCYNSGTVKVTSDAYVGGLVGNSDGTITDSYTIAKVLYISQAKAGSISGRVNQGVNNHLIRSFYNTDICGLPPFSGAINISENVKTTEEMESQDFLDGFSNDSYYEFGLENSQDSHYAPRLSALIGINDDIDTYSALSVRLRLFGWNDDSLAEWGSQDNPYLISSRKQLDDLSFLTSTYDYLGYYFEITNDVDMRIEGSYSNFSPIGYFADTHDYRAFNGTLDGNGYKISYLYINTTANYVGLIGMLGTYGSIKNLIIDENSQIQSEGSHIGSFVGRNMAINGQINRCVSYATVRGNTNIGGIVGYTYANTSVTNSLFNGHLQGNAYVYGVIGIPNDSVSGVDITNSWYIVPLASGYLTNGYNSTLFVDGNGDVEVIIDTAANNDKFIAFRLIADEHFTGVYMDSNDFVVSYDNLFYAINNTTLKSMYARFTLPVSASVTGYEQVIDIVGEGKYYCGQNVTIKVSFVEYGYFVNIFDFDLGTLKLEYQDYALRNDAENLWISFIMPHSFSDLSIGKILNIEIVEASEYVNVIANNNEYNGENNDAVATVNTIGQNYFENIILRYYFGTQKNLTENTANAGQYEVRARITAHSNFNLPSDLFIGIISKTFTITPKTISVSWQDILVKEYDSLDANQNVMVSNSSVFNLTGILEKDLEQVIAFCTVNWANANVGDNIELSATNFSLSGNMANNYFINSSYVLTGGIGIITAKNITVTIGESSLRHTYNNSKPTITDVTLTGNLGEVSLEFDFIAMQEIENPWDAGWYEVRVSTTNTNYIINLTEAYLEIVPIKIDTIAYSGFANLTYNGTDLATGIKGTYTTLYYGTDTVTLTFYYKEQQTGLSQVINAGQYLAVPSLNKNNYVLSESVNILSFIVKKATRASEIDISVMQNVATIGQGNLPIVINNIQDGELSLNKLNEKQRGVVNLLSNNGDFELELVSYGYITFTITEYNCQNYVDSTSGQITLEIKPQIVYVGLKETNWHYGDKIELEFVYYWDENQTQILTEQDINGITNFVRPQYRLTADNLVAGQNYEVKILGASSNNCEFMVSNNNHIEIMKRPIVIVVEGDNILNNKIYGDPDKPISYSVKDGVTNYMIDILPNGSPLEIIGSLKRESGENAGLYTINEGTITEQLNPNYDISFDIRGEYEIVRKGIRLSMPSLSKNYGVKDPVLLPELVDDFTLVGDDNIADIDITVTRMPGEDIGYYNYIVDYRENSGNYSILSVEVESRFEIKKGIASVKITSITPITWGENLDTGVIYGYATYLGQSISGRFSWLNGKNQVDSMQYASQILFTPDDNNISTTLVNETVPVAKRRLLVKFSGIFDYTYTGSVIEGNYQIELYNTALSKIPKAKGVVQGTAKNVGEYSIEATLTDDCDGVYELDADSKYTTLRIYPAQIIVSVEGADIVFGDKFTPTIKYSGFVGNDDESVLISPAIVDKLPSEIGYYLMTPSGAEAQNYTFMYLSSTLAIKKGEIVAENVKLKGILAPETSVTTAQLNSDTKEYADVAKSIDKMLGASIIKPAKSQMVEYLKFDIEGTLAGDTQYLVKLTKLDESAVLYIVNGDGSIKELSNYEVDSDGNLIFNSGNIRGVGVYKPKDLVNIILGYLPIAIAIVGTILVIVVSILISRFRRKLERARREYRLR